jgi:hypothetical protein
MVTARLIALTLAASPLFAAFPLLTAKGAARIWVSPDETPAVHYAARDLVRDIRSITGKTLAIFGRYQDCAPACVVISTANVTSFHRTAEQLLSGVSHELAGKWEAYRVQTVPGNLVIAGSDERGTMFGIYEFLARELKVDPMYFWTGVEPEKRREIVLDKVDLRQDEPTFHFRGWFINDEDLLSEWKFDGGKRELTYPFYQRVIPKELIDRIVESALRLQCNLIIPSSFVDITNADEAMLVEEATRRGLFLTMHHVEPLGVSGFTFQNFWRLRGANVPYSFVTQRARFDEIWRYYAERWARYPNVIWQVGLRGIADQPVWAADPDVPKTDAGRGGLISEAMEQQCRIIRSVDKRPHPLMTTTLWMEGAKLNRSGDLHFPTDVAVIFADNGRGWKWEPDFSETPRDKGRRYGVYEHLAFWSAGPHLVQGVSPEKSYEMIAQAVNHEDTYYAVLNVSNIRPFVLGVEASAAMLRNFPGFRPDEFLARWTERRFGPASAKEAAKAYQQFFAGYYISDKTQSATLLDGDMCHAIKRIAACRLSKNSLDASRLRTWEEQSSFQVSRWKESLATGEHVASRMDDGARQFFETNFLGQQRLALGLAETLHALAQAELEPGSAHNQMKSALSGLANIRAGRDLMTRGEWRDWYRGDRKMNLQQLEALVQQLSQ